jgi:hypothetical protein
MGVWAAAQPTPGGQDRVARIQLGQSLVPLYGPWRFSVGDSPVDSRSGRPLWAEADFDDSKWESVDLTPESGSINPIGGWSEFVPGWTVRGHAGYAGYAWYRIRVEIDGAQGKQLALAGPADVDDAYQVFANGVLLGSFGDFSGSRPAPFYAQPMKFLLPRQGENGGASEVSAVSPGSASFEIAVRVWMQTYSMLNAPESGGMHNPPVMGEVSAVAGANERQWLSIVRSFALIGFTAFLFAMLAIMAFGLAVFDRSDRVFLWMGAVLVFLALHRASTFVSAWTQWVSYLVPETLEDVILIPLIEGAWAMVWWVWFRPRRPGWMPKAILVLTVMLGVSDALADDLFFTLALHPASGTFQVVSVVLRAVFLALLVWIIAQGIRAQGAEGWMALPAVVLMGISQFAGEIDALNIRSIWFPFGVMVTLGQIANLILIATISVLLVRRLFVSVARQRLMALDVKQAQELQRVILPEAQAQYPGLEIETVFRPAREVGGDFFQVLPNASGENLLIVAGDVAGKGLQAGMLVALTVGAIRTEAAHTGDPVRILQSLNSRLCGRGMATCLALTINGDGEVTLANAGHIPPYRNGEPLEMEGALPLGVFEGAEPSVTHFRLEDGDRLVLMSDGIVEAMDANGQLFGFERIRALLGSPATAAEVADAAQAFGQEDDISVIFVTRAALMDQGRPALLEYSV